MRQQKLRRHDVVEIALVPETRDEYEAAMQSRARTVVLTMDQIREWNLSVDVVVMSEASAAQAIFGTDRDFYETVLEEDAADSPPENQLELGDGQPAAAPAAEPVGEAVAAE